MFKFHSYHYNDVMISMMASQITSLTIVYSTIYSGADQKRHQSSASLAFMRGIHRWPVNSLHKGPETRKMFPFDDIIIKSVFQKIGSYHLLYKHIFNHLVRLTASLTWTSSKIYLFLITVFWHMKVGFLCMLAAGGLQLLATAAKRKPDI